MNTLEIEFLYKVDFRLNVTPSAFYTYLRNVHLLILAEIPQLYMEPSSTLHLLQQSPSQGEDQYSAHAPSAV